MAHHRDMLPMASSMTRYSSFDQLPDHPSLISHLTQTLVLAPISGPIGFLQKNSRFLSGSYNDRAQQLLP